MYVCICNAVKERQVREAKCSGVCRVSEIYKHLGVRPQCGRCVPHIKELLSEPEATPGLQAAE